MKVILDLKGWIREIEAPKYAIDSGFIKAVLYFPLNLSVIDGEMISKDSTKIVMFRHTGKQNRDGLPIFQYET